MPRIDQYTAVTSPPAGFEIPGNDPNDHSMGSNGTTKYITAQHLLAGLMQVVNAVTDYGADPTGSTDSTTAIQNALLSFGTLTGWSQGNGGIVFLPQGLYVTSKPLIIPSGVTLMGTGWGSQISLSAGSNCDMIQWSSYNSSSQATILGVTASTIQNAFWAGVRDLCLHGDSFYTTVAGYHHGINISMNPATSQGGSDPDFDPMPFIQNVRIEACTGDGYFHSGRSGAYLNRVWSAYNNGIGFTTSFDTTLVNCLSEGNSTGGYFNHGSNTGAGCKFYNNNDNTWVSGHAYSVGNVVVYSGSMYFCIVAVTSATVPSSDTSHWTVLSGATAPAANGYDWYFDTGAGGHNWSAVESQEPSKGGFYFKGPNAGAISVVGQCEQVNFNNGQASYNSANPNGYAAVTFDGVSNVNVNLSSSSQSGGAGIICTTLNSPGPNTLVAVTDGTESSLFNGTAPTFTRINGAVVANAAGTTSGGHFYGSITSGGLTIVPNSNVGVGGGNANMWFDNGGQIFDFFNNGSLFGVYDQTNFVNLWSIAAGTGISTFAGTVKPPAGTTTAAPLLLTSGTKLTTAAAGAIEYDGTAFYATAQASSRQVMDAEQFITLTSAYTLTSQTAAQKLFNSTTNGALTVQASTTYYFECFFSLSSMSATSGSFGFALGGTATLTSQLWQTEGNKAALATAASAQNTVNTAANTTIVTANTTTTGWAKIWGKVRVNAAGTLIPQVSLGVAAAAVVGVDSYFRIWPVGASTVTNVGNWS